MKVILFFFFFFTAHAAIKSIENNELDKATQQIRPIKWISLGLAILLLFHEYFPK